MSVIVGVDPLTPPGALGSVVSEFTRPVPISSEAVLTPLLAGVVEGVDPQAARPRQRIRAAASIRIDVWGLVVENSTVERVSRCGKTRVLVAVRIQRPSVGVHCANCVHVT